MNDPVEKFGRYEVLRPLGKGAMGKVYLARDPVLERDVALKIIPVDPNLADDTRKDYLQRFSLEAKASAKLNHPSIVPVYDAGEQNGVPWIAFQFVEGETLESLLKRRGKLPLKRAVVFALDIAGALQHAHGWNIVHRDIKPANILIDAKTGVAMLADFGIVKAPWLGLTREGDAVGSPGYMSPEQIEGGEVDERSDLFSLGVVLYQMISGEHPFVRSTVAATAYATLSEAYTPLIHVVKDIPAPIERAVRRCLAADKRRRIRNAAELIGLLSASIPAEKGNLLNGPTTLVAAAPRPANAARRDDGFLVRLEKGFGTLVVDLTNSEWFQKAQLLIGRFVKPVIQKFIDRIWGAVDKRLRTPRSVRPDQNPDANRSHAVAVLAWAAAVAFLAAILLVVVSIVCNGGRV